MKYIYTYSNERTNSNYHFGGLNRQNETSSEQTLENIYPDYSSLRTIERNFTTF